MCCRSANPLILLASTTLVLFLILSLGTTHVNAPWREAGGRIRDGCGEAVRYRPARLLKTVGLRSEAFETAQEFPAQQAAGRAQVA
jgi:hypothetical protein